MYHRLNSISWWTSLILIIRLNFLFCFTYDIVRHTIVCCKNDFIVGCIKLLHMSTYSHTNTSKSTNTLNKKRQKIYFVSLKEKRKKKRKFWIKRCNERKKKLKLLFYSSFILFFSTLYFILMKFFILFHLLLSFLSYMRVKL